MEPVQSDCLICKRIITFNPPQELKYLSDFNQYENVQMMCPHCKKEGKETIVILNMNIPETEFDIEELEIEMFFPAEEIKRRAAARKMMWQSRPDLKEKDREAVERERIFQAEQHFGKNIELIKAENERIRRLELGE